MSYDIAEFNKFNINDFLIKEGHNNCYKCLSLSTSASYATHEPECYATVTNILGESEYIDYLNLADKASKNQCFSFDPKRIDLQQVKNLEALKCSGVANDFNKCRKKCGFSKNYKNMHLKVGKRKNVSSNWSC